jgi:hypothetical protein
VIASELRQPNEEKAYRVGTLLSIGGQAWKLALENSTVSRQTARDSVPT